MTTHVKNVCIILASLLLAAGISAFVAPKLAHFASPMFSSQIPGMSPELIAEKSLDLVEFGLTFVLGVTLGAANLFLLAKADTAIVVSLAGLGVLSFLLTRFANYSGKAVVGVVGIVEILLVAALWITNKTKTHAPDHESLPLAIFNGVFLGFYGLLILNRLTPIVIIPLTLLVLLPIFNYWLAKTNKKWSELVHYFPGVLLPLLLFFPTDLPKLTTWGVVALAIWIFGVLSKRTLLPENILKHYLYPAIVVALVAYNPSFAVGNFDSVEEGFWSGWVQRLSQGQVLYKDVLVYQPPIFIWGLHLFEKIWGYSLVTQRLFMHLLQVGGAVIYFFFVKKLVRKPWVIAITMLCFLGLTSTLVKNNVEIRVGLGLLSLLGLYRQSWLVAGALTAVALFSSIEVGLATGIASLAFIVFSNQPKIKVMGKWLVGLVIGALPFLGVMLWQKSLAPFIQQVSFYAGIFAKGYFNTPVDRAVSLSFFHWHIFNQYFGSTAMWFEVIKIGLFAAVIYGLYKKVTKTFSTGDNVIFATGVFGLILSRVALGRSDYLHLLFPLLIVIAIIGYAIDSLAKSSSNAAVIVALLLVFLGARDAINSSYLENTVYRLQAYGNPLGEYYTYSAPRGKGIWRDTQVTSLSENELTEYIATHTTANDALFAYPWYPEIYFLTNRRNATSIDTPYAFYTAPYQAQIIAELKINKPKLVIYNGDMNFGGMSVGAMSDVDNYLKANYKQITQFGKNSVMGPVN